jgi:hypothetical protein
LLASAVSEINLVLNDGDPEFCLPQIMLNPFVTTELPAKSTAWIVKLTVFPLATSLATVSESSLPTLPTSYPLSP